MDWLRAEVVPRPACSATGSHVSPSSEVQTAPLWPLPFWSIALPTATNWGETPEPEAVTEAAFPRREMLSVIDGAFVHVVPSSEYQAAGRSAPVPNSDLPAIPTAT